MANDKYYGYSPKKEEQKPSTGTTDVGTRLDRVNPYEFRKGMDVELTNLGVTRLRESTPEEREKATETVLNNLKEHDAYYSYFIQYEAEYRNKDRKPNFKTYLKELTDSYTWQEVNKEGKDKNNQMEEPKYYNSIYTLKEAIKAEVKKLLKEDEDKEPTKKDLKGIDKSIGDAKEALISAQKRVKELAPRIKTLAKETNAKVKKEPENKNEYFKVFQSDPDVKEFIKLRKVLKDAGLL